MLLHDNETKVDMLNNRAIAKTVVKVIRECGDRPISIGIHGDWGAGKSSILAMIEEEFENNNKEHIVCIRFNGWKHQGFEDSKIALMSAIVSELTEKLNLWTKAKDTLEKLWKNINWISVAKAAGSVALTAATGIPPIGMLTSVLSGLESTLSDKDKVSTAIGQVGNYLSEAKVFEDVSLAKEFSEFQKSFEELLEKSNIKKLVVLIDDLDRCLPKVTIETLEAVRLFLFTKSTAFIIAADESMIEYAVRSHFPDLPEDNELNTGYKYSQRYLEKLIQVPFRIPALGTVDSEMYITLLLIGSGLREEDPQFEKLLLCALEKMKKPWENQGFTADEIREVFGDRFESISEQFFIANQIGDILAKNTEGNPRKIKRFINMLLLRKQIAEARGFGDSIKIPVMAKLMLAEQFFAKEYKDIAILLDADGICQQLKDYEVGITAESIPKERSRKRAELEKTADKPITINASADKADEDAYIKEWRSNKEFEIWVTSEPLLGAEDIRPYFFASKESENILVEQVKNDQLRQLISKLMGGAMSVASVSDQINNLPNDDAKKVFSILSHRILQSGDITNPPKGVDGIKAIVANHECLELELVSLIEMFDCTKVGAWVCSGWEKCIKSQPAKQRMSAYQERLSKTGTPFARKAAALVLKSNNARE